MCGFMVRLLSCVEPRRRRAADSRRRLLFTCELARAARRKVRVRWSDERVFLRVREPIERVRVLGDARRIVVETRDLEAQLHVAKLQLALEAAALFVELEPLRGVRERLRSGGQLLE